MSRDYHKASSPRQNASRHSGRHDQRNDQRHEQRHDPKHAQGHEKGHGRRLHGLGEDPGLAPLLARLSKENLSEKDLPADDFSVQIAPRGLMGPLLEELGPRALAVRGRAVLAKGTKPACWAQNVWLEPFWLPVGSISDAARKLAERQRNWRAHLDFESGLNRRATLIEQALPHISSKPFQYGQAVPKAPLGAFLLWQPGMVLASCKTTSPFADGELQFEENKTVPPGRAYLKLWEAFTLLGKKPGAGDLCIELGAAPGSWTWVLAQTGCHIFSLDKAPLADHIACLPNVEHCIGSGFALTPDLAGRADWLFSDMICYPERLYTLVSQWIEAKAMKRALCTIKFQSSADHAMLSRFLQLPGSSVRHLSCNKHELTWFWEDPECTDTAQNT